MFTYLLIYLHHLVRPTPTPLSYCRLVIAIDATRSYSRNQLKEPTRPCLESWTALGWQSRERLGEDEAAFGVYLKPRPHKQQCRSNIIECYKSNVASTLLPIWQQRCRFRQQCRTKSRPFDTVETNLTCSICFDFVERTKFYDKLVQHCCRFLVECCFDKVERCFDIVAGVDRA